MKNLELLNSEVNRTFDEVLLMKDNEFKQWVIDLRKLVVDLWDNKDLPPRVGYDESEIIKGFNDLAVYPLHQLELKDELTKENNVIRNTANFSGYINDYFPTMMKTRISYSSKGNAKSIYDYFANSSLLDTFMTYASRHFKRDSFYHYSVPISQGDVLELGLSPYTVTTAESFRGWFETHRHALDYDYWLCPVKEDNKYTGFNSVLMKKKNLFVTADFEVAERCRTNVDKSRSNKYSIRLYKKGQKLFPPGLKAFKISFCQYAVNFPPLIARYIYEKFTEHITDQEQINVYDPSAGWGGRLIGAMAVETSDRNIHYIGTDPNTDHNITPGYTKYHQIADLFNKHVRHDNTLFIKAHSYEIFQKGSEVIRFDPNFQKYKGKIDFVFTSPPYWCKEIYSDDDTQSCHAYKQYDDWKTNFLKPTLETCVEYLKKDRYLAWNIADIVVDGKTFPLEQDSQDILEALGMKYITTMKMTLAQMPGANRLLDTGEKETITTSTVLGTETEERAVVKGMMKNFVKVANKGKKIFLKYEPIMIYYKE